MDAADSQTDDRPLYSRRRRTALRVVVLVAVATLILPVLINLYSVSAATAANACRSAVAYEVPDARGATVRFELFGPGFLGWECYAVGAFGGDRHVVSLGLVPGMVEIPHGVRT